MEFSDYSNMYTMLKQTVDRYGETSAYKWFTEPGQTDSVTWNQFYGQVRQVGKSLMALGVEKNNKVNILSYSCYQWVLCDMGITSIGSVTVGIYQSNLAKDVRYIVDHSDAVLIFAEDNAQLAKLMEIRAEIPDIRKVVLFAGDVPADDWVISFKDFLALGRDVADTDFDSRADAVTPSDPAGIVYTSGTTGPPKGVMLTHNNFVSNARGVLEVLPISESDIALSFLPLSHSFERLAGYYALVAGGGTIAYAESIDKVPDNIQEIRPTVMCSVPRLYEKMHARVLATVEAGPALKKKLFSWGVGVGGEVSRRITAKQALPGILKLKYKVADRLVFEKLRARMGDRLRFFVSGGAPLAREIAEFFHAAGILILEGYGLTETTPVISANRPDAYKFGSVRQPLPNLEVRIAPDGEILVKGPSVMRGYYNRPEETRKVLTEDGWFATGDIGYLDQDNFLHITDRKKDIIVTAGGKNIAPQNIENLLKLNRFIEQVCIIGDKRKYLAALISPSFPELEDFARENGISVEPREQLVEHPRVRRIFQEAIDEANAQLARYESIKRFSVLPVEFSPETGELTPTLKVKRKVVETRYKEQIDRMYAE